MRLELFDKIDQTINILKENYEFYDCLRKEIKFSLLDALDSDNVLSIATRIKQPDSLKEKIIRNKLYNLYETPQEIIDNLSDLIGLKIECRFNDDEIKIYNKLLEIFKLADNEEYGHCDKYPNIYLELRSPQPKGQRNGFSIYRIDGYYKNENTKIPFELQIKSMVNSFWGDIEHKLVYKNTNYYVYDDFVKGMLNTIKGSLTVIDTQLHTIFDELDSDKSKKIKEESQYLSLEIIVAKALNDLFIAKLKDSLGFSINLKETSTILANFLLKKGLSNIEDEDINNNAFDLLNLFNKIENYQIDFQEEIKFEEDCIYDDKFKTTLSQYLQKAINFDYDWHVFFKILFSIEPGNNSQDFELFLTVLENNLIDENEVNNKFKTIDDLNKLKNDLLELLAKSLIDIGDISMISNKKMQIIKKAFNNLLNQISNEIKRADDFNTWKDTYYKKMAQEISDISK